MIFYSQLHKEQLARAKTIQSKYNYQNKYLLFGLYLERRSKIDAKKNIDLPF